MMRALLIRRDGFVDMSRAVPEPPDARFEMVEFHMHNLKASYLAGKDEYPRHMPIERRVFGLIGVGRDVAVYEEIL
jgi:hypothetical protein